MALIGFLLKVVVISLSGVMAPGPVTAAALAAGTRSRHAGGLMAVGHGLVEAPLMLLIMAGMSRLFESEGVRIGIGVAGGVFLLLMGGHILKGTGGTYGPARTFVAKSPVWIGVILTGGNPYFLLWWATVGLALAVGARELGVLAFGLFALVHWLCDLAWLEVLSWAGFKGSRLLGARSGRIVPVACGLALIVFGVMFIYDAWRSYGSI